MRMDDYYAKETKKNNREPQKSHKERHNRSDIGVYLRDIV